MQQALFLSHKLCRQICLNGVEVKHVKMLEDKYHQKNEETEKSNVCVLWHTTNTYVNLTGADAGRITSKSQPMCVVMKEEADRIELRRGDIIINGDNKYTVSEMFDVLDMGVAYDVSLEVMR